MMCGVQQTTHRMREASTRSELYIRSRARVNIAVRRVSLCRIACVPCSLAETKNGGHSGQVKDVTSSAS
jgi:hypothetical protein